MNGRIPIIGVTADAREAQIQTAMEAGMVCHLLLSLIRFQLLLRLTETLRMLGRCRHQTFYSTRAS